MSLLSYNFFLKIYASGIYIASFFNKKAKLWQYGRKQQQSIIAQFKTDQPVAWFHCASVGEYEQGRPLMEKLKQKNAAYFILVTFFSPSGYESKKADVLIDLALYLPLDGKQASKAFIDQIKPSIVFFVRYEFWYFYFSILDQKKIPFYIISAHFRPNQLFFNIVFGSFFRKLLQFPNHIFVQNEDSARLLDQISVFNHTVTGDTRTERVLEIKTTPFSDPILEAFSNKHMLFVAGSTWPKDEEIIHRLIQFFPRMKFVIIPHEIEAYKTMFWQNKYGSRIAIYSNTTSTEGLANKNILYIDTIGLLSKIYRYSHIAYVGGGFGRGIHNILEAAVYEKPVLFGPNYQRFPEATTLVQNKGAFSVRNSAETEKIIQQLISDNSFYTDAKNATRSYFLSAPKATDLILATIQV